MVFRCPSAKGCVKLGQPVPLSNLAPPLNKGRPHSRHVKTPSRFSVRKTPQKGASVPCSSRTCFSCSSRSATSDWNCSSVGGVRSKVLWSAARSWGILRSFAAGVALITGAVHAQPAAQPVETPAEALSEDATQYAAQHGVAPVEALRRLRAQQASVAATDLIARDFAPRLAGISIEHKP